MRYAYPHHLEIKFHGNDTPGAQERWIRIMASYFQPNPE